MAIHPVCRISRGTLGPLGHPLPIMGDEFAEAKPLQHEWLQFYGWLQTSAAGHISKAGSQCAKRAWVPALSQMQTVSFASLSSHDDKVYHYIIICLR